jgi:hypothetical protein
MIVTLKHAFFSGGPLGNWYGCPLKYKGMKFNTTEQLFMYLKAKHFEDEEVAQKILESKSPSQAKELGRTISGFNEEDWKRVREDLMCEALRAKYECCIEMKRILDDHRYKLKEFVECNPNDKIWSCGLSIDKASVLAAKNWTGLNLLGKCLTKVKNEVWKKNML